jgi:hypothetical protein
MSQQQRGGGTCSDFILFQTLFHQFESFLLTESEQGSERSSGWLGGASPHRIWFSGSMRAVHKHKKRF